MPKHKTIKRDGDRGPIDFAYLEKMKRENPDDYFSDEETERRMAETMRRFCNQPRQMNFKTGQNLKPPFLSPEELKRRGYPANDFPFE